MITCFEAAERYEAIVSASGSRIHQGAENSPWKNTAPSSFTAFNTSDKTSMEYTLAMGQVSANRFGRRDKDDSRVPCSC